MLSKIPHAFFLSFLVLVLLLPVEAHAQQERPVSFADMAERLLPTVVNISSTQKIDEAAMPELPAMPEFPEGSPFEDFMEEFFNRDRMGVPQAVPATSLGSGFVIDAKEGYIITNNHVIRHADEVRVTFHNDKTLDAEIVGSDEKTDIAVLKIDPTKANLVAANFGDSDDIRVGDWILAIGNPFGLGGTVTSGIISARKRNINAGPYDDFLQTDASINRGNSGGPMFNMDGQVIGINTAIYSPTGGSVGIGFAIPSTLAQPVIDQLIKYGETRRGWLGVRIQTVTEDIADSLGLKKVMGTLVANVTADGPAEKAGIIAGDVVLKFNGKDVKEMRELPRLVAEAEIGKPATVTLWRDGKEKDVSVTLGQLEKAEADGELTHTELPVKKQVEGVIIEGTGLTVEPLTNQARKIHNIPESVDGVLVSMVDNNSKAAEKGFLPGDVIVEINQKSITVPADAQTAIDQAKNTGRGSVLMLVNRQGVTRFVAIKLKK